MKWTILMLCDAFAEVEKAHNCLKGVARAELPGYLYDEICNNPDYADKGPDGFRIWGADLTCSADECVTLDVMVEEIVERTHRFTFRNGKVQHV